MSRRPGVPAPSIGPMGRARILVASSMVAAVAVAGAACGDGGSAGGTLPPIQTTTTLPPTTTTTTTIPTRYRVKSGDNLTRLAARWGVSLDELMTLNKITNPDHIFIGQNLKVPKPPPTTTTLPPTTSTMPDR